MSLNEEVETNVNNAIWSMKQAIKNLESSKAANPVGVDYYLGVAKSFVEQAHIHVDNADGWLKDPFSGVK